MEAEKQLKKLKVAELKAQLQEHGLPVTGNKAELVERLAAFLSSQQDDEVESDAHIGDDAAESGDVHEAVAAMEEGFEEEEAGGAELESTDKEEEGSVKLDTKKLSTELTEEERAAARAARFGIQSKETEETKKAARAARFGVPMKGTGESEDAELEKKKKRAERFGVSSSSSINKNADKNPSNSNGASEEQLARLKARAERFGESTSAMLKADEKRKAQDDVALKKKQRLERFGGKAAGKGAVDAGEQARLEARAARFGTA